MDIQTLTFIIVGLTFALYIGIAIWSRAGSTNDFYVAGGGVHPIANGMATAADWMSAATYISMAGIIAFAGYDGSVYLMGWTVVTCCLLCVWRLTYGNSVCFPCLILSVTASTRRQHAPSQCCARSWFRSPTSQVKCVGLAWYSRASSKLILRRVSSSVWSSCFSTPCSAA